MQRLGSSSIKFRALKMREELPFSNSTDSTCSYVLTAYFCARLQRAIVICSQVPDVARLATFSEPLARLKQNPA
ncbi:MAG: hypothetical protein H7Y30_09810 [Pyrinomonadaceae bacterium]|nr:hypothetical protein [Pyrinomonadaceae bacterium]